MLYFPYSWHKTQLLLEWWIKGHKALTSSQSLNLWSQPRAMATVRAWACRGFWELEWRRTHKLIISTKKEKKKLTVHFHCSFPLIETAAVLIHSYLLSKAILNPITHFWPCPAGGSRWTWMWNNSTSPYRIHQTHTELIPGCVDNWC